MTVDCQDKSLLMAYLYDECEAAERAAFERHLAVCAACRLEVAELRSVRGVLQEWTPPETVLNFRIVSDETRRAPVVKLQPRSRWTTVPAWARLAAAVLVLAVGAAIARLDVRFGDGGVTIRTGWQTAAPATDRASTSTQPWRADLAALERNLRRELASTQVAASMPDPASAAGSPAASGIGSPGASGVGSPGLSAQNIGMASPGFSAGTPARGLTAAETAELARRFQALIADSERRQEQTFEHLLATRLVQFARDVDAQRRSDLVRIQQGLGQVDTRTTSELAQMREMQRYLMRVANIQEIK